MSALHYKVLYLRTLGRCSWTNLESRSTSKVFPETIFTSYHNTIIRSFVHWLTIIPIDVIPWLSIWPFPLSTKISIIGTIWKQIIITRQYSRTINDTWTKVWKVFFMNVLSTNPKTLIKCNPTIHWIIQGWNPSP